MATREAHQVALTVTDKRHPLRDTSLPEDPLLVDEDLVRFSVDLDTGRP